MSGKSISETSYGNRAPYASKSGWLVKQGHIFRTWKRRWFVLEGPLLKYYKSAGNDDAQTPVLQELKGCVTLNQCEVTPLAPSEVDGRPFGFKLSPISKKIFLICAPDEEARQAWMEAVAQNSCARAGSTAELNPLEANDPDPANVHNVATGVSDGEAGVTLSDFALLTVIGRGTYGKVMQVRLRETGEIFAMKVLKKENIFARGDPKDLQHTMAERNVLALLNSHAHPFILGLKFAFQTPAKLYYVLKFCNGGDLYYLLSRCKKFMEQHARFYAGEVFLAIEHIHSLGVIYRDLKPENVLLDSDGHVKLTDFGLVKEAETADTFCGTPVYLAPEIWLRRAYGCEVDFWSLGCVIYEMICGLPPFWADSIKDVYYKVLKTEPKFPPMSVECQTLIQAMLSREPSRRLGSGEGGSAAIRHHPFFAPQSWDELFEKRIPPPFKSKASNQEDTNNFHALFTNQRPVDSLTSSAALNAEQQAHFDGFTYGDLRPSQACRSSE